MGLFSGGNSRSSSTNYTENTVANTSFSEIGGGAASVQGDGNSVQFLDGNSINRSFSFGESALNYSRANVGDVLNFAELGLLEGNKIARAVSENAGRQTQEAVKAVTESARTGAENIARQAGTLAGFALAAWVAIKLFRG